MFFIRFIFLVCFIYPLWVFAEYSPNDKNELGCMTERGNVQRTGVYEGRRIGTLKHILWELPVEDYFSFPHCGKNLLFRSIPTSAVYPNTGKVAWANSMSLDSDIYYYKGLLYTTPNADMTQDLSKTSIRNMRWLLLLSPKTGRLVSRVAIPYKGAILLIYRDIVYLQSDSKLFALDLKNKLIKWAIPMRTNMHLSTDGRLLFAINNHNYLLAIRLRDGKIQWRKHYSGLDSDYIVVSGNQVLFSQTVLPNFIDNPSTRLALQHYILALEKNDGHLRWVFNLEGEASMGIAVDEHDAFIAAKHITTSQVESLGGMYAINVNTGKLLWKIKMQPISAPIVIGNDIIVKTQMFIYKIDKSFGNILIKRSMKSASVNQNLFVRNGDLITNRLKANQQSLVALQ